MSSDHGQDRQHAQAISNAITTITLKKVAVGTELNIVQEGVPDAIPVEACYLGWQESLENLKRLVEPDIKP